MCDARPARCTVSLTPAPHPLLQGLSYTASTDEIKRAYRRLAKEFHPDVSADESNTEFAIFLNDVYDVSAWQRKGRVVWQDGIEALLVPASQPERLAGLATGIANATQRSASLLTRLFHATCRR